LFDLNSSLQGRKFQRIPINENLKENHWKKLHQICEEGRLRMIESLSDFDDSLADQILSSENGFDGVTIENIDQVRQFSNNT